jgi:hypothetical protein
MALGVFHVWLGEEDLGIYDENKFSLNDAFVVKASCGLDVRVFTNGINTMNPLVLQTLVWWLRYKKGVNCDRASIDFAIADLKLVDEPDPTKETSGSGAAATSVS